MQQLPLRRDHAVAVIVAFAVPLVVLLASVRTSVGQWDTADLQTVVWIAGIPYPTGFPGYVLFGWLWTHALPFGSVAARINALSAVSVAAGAATITAFALLLDVLPALAVLGGWVFVFARVIWLRATYADVHPLGFAVAFAALVLAARWTRRGEPRALAAAIVLGGIALAVDSTTVLILAGGVVIALGRALPARTVLRAAAVAALIVVAAYAYLPLRSAYVTQHRLDPTLALGIEPGRPFWDDHHPSTADGFIGLVSGSEWTPGYALRRVLTPRSVSLALDRFGDELNATAPFGALAVAAIGLVLLALRAPVIALGLALAAFVPAVFGASYRAEADPERYVFALYALGALGAAVALDRAVRALGRRGVAIPLAVACALLSLQIGYDVHRSDVLFALRDDSEASELGARVEAGTRPDAIVVAPWNWATSLAYRAYVERAFGTRIVVCALPTDHLDDYPRWARLHQLTIVSNGEPYLPGFRTRPLTGGVPQVYEIVP